MWVASTLLVYALLVQTLHVVNADGTMNLLVFGGNGFIGSATVSRILNLNMHESIILVNRQSYYWDFGDRIWPFVRNVKCDRTHLKACSELANILNADPLLIFDAVIDFSGYGPDDISTALDVLQGRVKLYVFISSDSVYDVNATRINNNELIKEEDSNRHENKMKNKLGNLDEYGIQKLLAEEMLREQSNINGIPYVILRLSDVLGSRDNTYRFWTYMMWMRLRDYVNKELQIPEKHEHSKLSFVFADDVADVIATVLKKNKYIMNQTFNLAFRETPTLRQLLNDIRISMKLPEFDIKVEESVTYFYPSVSCGALNISKAITLLSWNPTPWNEAIRQTVNFYNEAYYSATFRRQGVYMIETLQNDFGDIPGQIRRALRSIEYTLPETKDEL